jgi:hypothetical protein
MQPTQLTREGYPYRAFATSHPRIVSAAQQLHRTEAAAQLLTLYLRAAVFGTHHALVSLFQLLLNSYELDEAVRNLTSRGVIEVQRIGKTEVVTLTTRDP